MFLDFPKTAFDEIPLEKCLRVDPKGKISQNVLKLAKNGTEG